MASHAIRLTKTLPLALNSELEISLELFSDENFFQFRVIGQAIFEWWVIFSGNQWLQVVPRLLGNAEAIFGDKRSRHFLFHIGDLGQ